jgi:muramoyltetrapeptide carboxypeptidase
MPLIPLKLQKGDLIRIVAPSKSLGVVSEANRRLAIAGLEALGLRVSFGKHVEVFDLFGSSSIAERVSDLHAAFEDPEVKGILTVLGGYNVNQVLPFLDYGLIQSNPKILCGFSDITALQNALWAKAGLVTYSGPHFSTFSQQKGFEYTKEFFHKMLFEESPVKTKASSQWSDDAWYLDQENRTFYDNHGMVAFQEGRAKGRLLGGNLGTLQLLHGTPYMPSLEGAVLFLEEVTGAAAAAEEFDRCLESLTQDPTFKGVRALVLGRFETSFKMTGEKLDHILKTKKALEGLPIIAGVDFGHTCPFFTFPIGGFARVEATKEHVHLQISDEPF